MNAEDILDALNRFYHRGHTGFREIGEFRAYINNAALPSDICAALESLRVRFWFDDAVIYECDLAEMVTLIPGENECRATPRKLHLPFAVNGLSCELFPGIKSGRCEQALQIRIYACGDGFASWTTHFLEPGVFVPSWGVLFAKVT